jgi:pyrroline-5-carboxylate reductase
MDMRKLGFIGTGAITEHVITGLIAKGGYAEDIVVSDRSRERSAKLAERFSNIRVESENQAIVNQVDMVFVGVLPQQTLEVLESLTFRPDQVIVSMAAIVSVQELAEAVKPATQIHRIIPMPPNEIGVGPIPIFPSSPEVEALLSKIGTIVPVGEEQHFSTFSAGSAVMATFFELVATHSKWLQEKGVPAKAATRYSTSLFQALATQITGLSPEGLQELSEECLTVGGLNEQLLMATRQEGWYEELQAGLGKILERVS